jgi:hypothetical protein
MLHGQSCFSGVFAFSEERNEKRKQITKANREESGERRDSTDEKEAARSDKKLSHPPTPL